ncbi:hypothetical protein SUGI_0631880 [Cryptomeria japonica]|nr:hypothetical protein SUGI_0631880 [Cryptomeria japonica]
MVKEFECTTRESMAEIVRTLRGMNRQWTVGRPNTNGVEGSHSANGGFLVNPSIKTFRAKFLQRDEEDPFEEEQKVPPRLEDDMARYHAEYNALNLAIGYHMSFMDYYDMKTRNNHSRGRYQDQSRRDLQQ